jgi:pyruvate formate lyase activating enzyme
MAETLESETTRFNRRTLLGGGAVLLAASGLSLFLCDRENAVASVFVGDAPSGELWEAWKRRGWAREAAYYFRLGKNIQCRLCPNACLLAPGDRGHCRNRVHKEGKLYTLAYGNPCTMHVDPIEKKPLFHYLPGAKAFSLATAGCNLRCKNCQNWEISQTTPERTKDPTGPSLLPATANLLRLDSSDMARLSLFPDDVVQATKASGAEVVAYTYSEPITAFEYVRDTARAARAAGLHNVWISNGTIEREPLFELCPLLDAANVNLKSYSPEVYAELNGGTLEPVLRTLKRLKERGVWLEVTNLVVPTYTDKLDVIRRMCGWLVSELGPEQPLHLSRFHPKYLLEHLPPTPQDSLLRAREIARGEGLRHVYLGNVAQIAGAEDTLCANCSKVVVERQGFHTGVIHLRGGHCEFCGAKVAGIWRV